MGSRSDRRKSSAKKKLSLTGNENSVPPFHDVAYYRCEKGDKVVTHIRYTAVNAPVTKSIHNIRTPISKSITTVTPSDSLPISKRRSSLYYTPENDIPNSLEEDDPSSSEEEEQSSNSVYTKAVQERNKKKNQEALILLKKTAKALGDSKDSLMLMESRIHTLFCADQNSDGLEPKKTIDEIGCMVELLQSMMVNFHEPSP
ncbi:hypothetical protein Ddc_02277 [Ditylenchus destructor]|nr:hypothetical protein Ddc_02277 [Ditylenchus destructor]